MPQLPNHLSALPHVANELPQPNPQSSGTEGPGLGVGDGGHSYIVSGVLVLFLGGPSVCTSTLLYARLE